MSSIKVDKIDGETDRGDPLKALGCARHAAQEILEICNAQRMSRKT